MSRAASVYMHLFKCEGELWGPRSDAAVCHATDQNKATPCDSRCARRHGETRPRACVCRCAARPRAVLRPRCTAATIEVLRPWCAAAMVCCGHGVLRPRARCCGHGVLRPRARRCGRGVLWPRCAAVAVYAAATGRGRGRWREHTPRARTEAVQVLAEVEERRSIGSTRYTCVGERGPSQIFFRDAVVRVGSRIAMRTDGDRAALSAVGAVGVRLAVAAERQCWAVRAFAAKFTIVALRRAANSVAGESACCCGRTGRRTWPSSAVLHESLHEQGAHERQRLGTASSTTANVPHCVWGERGIPGPRDDRRRTSPIFVSLARPQSSYYS
jgi:hypothetical protein